MFRDKQRLSRLVALLGVLSMSSSVVFIRRATAPSAVLALYRMFISALLMLPVVLVAHRGEYKGTRAKDWLLWCGAGISFAMHFLTYFLSLEAVSISAAVMLSCTEVFYVALGAYAFFHERISRKGWIGIGITFAGCVLLAVAQGMQGGGSVRGVILGVISAVFAAIFTMLGRHCRAEVSNPAYSLVVYLIGSAVLLAACLLNGQKLTGYGAENLLAALIMAVMCTILGHGALTWALRYQPASYVSSLKMLTPAASTLFGWIFLGEKPLVSVLLCCAVIVLGILYYFRSQTDPVNPDK